MISPSFTKQFKRRLKQDLKQDIWLDVLTGILPNIQEGDNMSNKIREYKSLYLGNNYCALSQNKLLDLIKTIKKRINYKTGYAITDCKRDNILYKE